MDYKKIADTVHTMVLNLETSYSLLRKNKNFKMSKKERAKEFEKIKKLVIKVIFHGIVSSEYLNVIGKEEEYLSHCDKIQEILRGEDAKN
jgi:hypothetical protein